jgi:hypothetical protein
MYRGRDAGLKETRGNSRFFFQNGRNWWGPEF